jgi:hypothetical protein
LKATAQLRSALTGEFLHPKPASLRPQLQNAADLEFPAADPTNAPDRAEFKRGIFPPDHHVAPAEPTPTPPAPQAK